MAARVLFTDRSGGHSAAPFATLNIATHVGDDLASVTANRAEVARRVGVPADRLVVLASRAGGPVGRVDAETPGEMTEVEALVTTVPGMALAVSAADCVPVLLAEDTSGVIAAAHAGRRGVDARIVSDTVEAMRRLGSTPERITAWLGPAICGRCYEVGDDVAAITTAIAPQARSQTSWGTTALDLPRAVHAELVAAGITAVQTSDRCTYEDPQLFSYRRDGRTGRQASVIVIDEPTGDDGSR